MVHRCLPCLCASALTLGIAGAALAAPYYFTALSPVGSYTTLSLRVQYGEWPVRGRRQDRRRYSDHSRWLPDRLGRPGHGQAPPPARTSCPTFQGLPRATGFRASTAMEIWRVTRKLHPTLSPGSCPPAAARQPSCRCQQRRHDRTAYGLNNSQQVVGLSGSNSEAGQAVIWTQTRRDVGSRRAAQSARRCLQRAVRPSQASAISSNGVVAGWSNVLVGGIQEQDAVTWTNNGSGWVANDLSLLQPHPVFQSRRGVCRHGGQQRRHRRGLGLFLGGDEPTGIRL